MNKFVEILIQSLTKISGKTFYLLYWKGQIMNNHIWCTCCFPQPKVWEGLFSKKKIFLGVANLWGRNTIMPRRGIFINNK